MKLVFIYGPPASGKLTVARELAALTGYKLFHNHLVVEALRGAVAEAGGELVFVRLECGDAEIERRLDDPSRRGGAKLRSIDVYRELKAAGAFDAPQMPEPAIAIDTEASPAAAAAARIAAFLGPR